MLIPETSNIFLYGRGVFTTLLIISGEPFLWEKHWRRLTANALALKIDLSEFSEQLVFQTLIDKVREDQISDGRSRITFADERPGRLWRVKEDVVDNTKLIISTGDLRPIPDNLKLTVSPYPINSQSPIAGVKSCNYLENILGFDEAKGRGFDEAIRLNELGYVTSGCMANIFWIKKGQLYTPELATGCLAGTTREFVIENLACEEVEAGTDELAKADAIFMTSAGIGIIAAAELNGKRFEASENPITTLLSVARNAG